METPDAVSSKQLIYLFAKVSGFSFANIRRICEMMRVAQLGEQQGRLGRGR